MKKKVKTIRFKMFISYTVIIVAMSLVLFVTISSFIFSTLRNNTYSSLESIIGSQMNNIDKEVESMDALALNVLYSPVTREVFVESPENSEEEEQWSAEISNMMSLFANPAFTVPQIMLFDFNSHGVGTDSNHIRNTDITKIAWYTDVMSEEANIYLTVPYSGLDDSMSTSRFTGSELISLCRVVRDRYGEAKGIVEVKQYYSKIFNEIDDFIQRDTYVSAIVLNEKGEQIYPLNNIQDTSKSDISKMQFSEQEREEQHFESKEGQIMGYRKSPITGWTLYMIWDQDKALARVYSYTIFFAVSVLVIMVIALLNAYFVSAQISKPIEVLRKRIMQLDVNNSLPELEKASGLSEIDAVNHTLDKVSVKLTRTVNAMMQSQQQELQAKMLALQSQMNPHFLYNSLSVICALAEEKRMDQIIYTCKNLSSMLRYISSGKSNIVAVAEEIAYTKQYLECMKIRYGEYLKYSIDMPEEVKRQYLPKLSIQPLVENSIKSCTQCEDPWIISITGFMEDDIWKISVKDNGGGVTEEEKEKFYSKVNYIEESGTFETLELGGMGMVNVYMRLKFQYHEKTIFEIGDSELSGANITIGGAGRK